MLDGHNDHRIVMALSVLATSVGGTIRGAEAVAKSYPDFFEVLQALGIRRRSAPEHNNFPPAREAAIERNDPHEHGIQA